LTAAGVVGSLVGATATASASVSSIVDTYGDRFGTVVNVVDDAGADNTGQQPIDDVLDQYHDDDTLLVFPSGRYLMHHQFRFTGFDNFGMVGDDATFVPGTMEAMDGNVVTQGTFSGPARMFRLGVSYAPGKDLLFKGFNFDYTAPSTGLRAIETYVSTGLLVEDIDVNGQHDTGTFGPALFAMTDPSAIGTVNGFRAEDGGVFSDQTIGSIWRGPTGILTPPGHEGKLWLRNCKLGGFPDNGVYVSGYDGRVIVQGGTFKNSNASNIRLRGDYSEVHDAEVVVDGRTPGSTLSGTNQRAIRMDAGKGLWVENTTIKLPDPNGNAITVLDQAESARIQNCDVSIADVRTNAGIVVQNDAGAVDILDTSIDYNCPGNAIKIRGHNTSDDAPVLVQNVTITGDAPGSNGRNAIRSTRANVIFQYLDVNQPGPDYRRAIEIHGNDNAIVGGTFEATHIPIVNVASGTSLKWATSESLDGYVALKLYGGESDVTVTDCTLYDGYDDNGTASLTMSGNDYPTS